MGLEAASRGAKKVYCIDSDPKCAFTDSAKRGKAWTLELVQYAAATFAAPVSELRDNGIQIDIAFFGSALLS